MTFTTAFLFLFITIIIPGFIFLRIYFYGDFSKQFTTKENISKLLLTSLIPGLLISILYLPLYNYFSGYDVKVENILTLFEKMARSKVHEDVQSLSGFANFGGFLNYCVWEFALSVGLGFLFSRVIVRGLALDRKWKTLRYKNQWYYVFSGEVFEFGKFKRATRTLEKIKRNGKEVQLARVDVLIKGANGSELYTGFVADYDLNPTDISKLDNLYLLDAIRYKTNESLILSSIDKQIKNVEKKLIPGELFVLNMTNLININVSYLLAPVKAKIKGQVSNKLNILIKSLTFGLFLPLSVFIFYSPSWMDWFFLTSFPWYVKLPFFSLYMNFISLINPRYDQEQKVHVYRKKDLTIGLWVLVSLIIFCLIISWFKIYI